LIEDYESYLLMIFFYRAKQLFIFYNQNNNWSI